MSDPNWPPTDRPGLGHTGYYDGWEVSMWWDPRSKGGPTELRVRALSDDQVARGITTGTLRNIPLAEIISEMQEDLEGLRAKQTAYNPSEDMVRGYVREISRTVATEPKPGRRGRSESFHAAVAAAYAYFSRRSHANPLDQFARACDVNRSTASSWVRQARAHGMLTALGERQAGGDLTDKAIEVLTEQEEGDRA